jgi:hypothetical protein
MGADLVAYGFYDPAGTEPKCVVRKVSARIAEYLDDHRTELAKKAASDGLMEATFLAPEHKKRFDALRDGTKPEFITASQELASRLFETGDNRAGVGFVVAARFSTTEKGATTTSAAFLKLDANEEPLAALHREAQGEPTLEEVEGLLDLPGHLQKGAVYPDSRTGRSQLVVGDKYDTDYFREAVGVSQRERPALGVARLLASAQDIAPEIVEPLTVLMEATDERVTVPALLDDLPVPPSPEKKQRIVAALSKKPKPVELVDPGNHQLVGYVEANGVTITGAATKIRDDVTWQLDPEHDGYLIQVRVSDEPSKRFK